MRWASRTLIEDGRALLRPEADTWPMLQGTVTATLAWAIAGNPDPFFAPIAAFVALNASVGERGLNAIRLLLSVVVGAILTVVAAGGQAGTERLVDALIGVGVALLFTQVLFAPQPLALLRRAQAAALGDMAEGLRLTASALEADDEDAAEQAMSYLRTLRDRLSELERTRAASGRVARRSTRQEAADGALDVARRLAIGGIPVEPQAIATIVGL